MIRHTPFKPLLLPALIAGVLSASYSFNASADCFDDGFRAGQSSCPTTSCPTTSCPTVSDRYSEGYSAGAAYCQTVTQPTCPTVTQPTCPTVSDRYSEGYNAGAASVVCPSTPAAPSYSNCTDGQTSSCLLTSSQKAVSNSLSTYDTNSHALISVAENNKITDNTYCNSAREGAAAKLSKDLFLTLPNLDASALDKDLKTSSANLKYQAEGFVIDNKGAHAFTVESLNNISPLANPLAKVKLRLLAVGGNFTTNEIPVILNEEKTSFNTQIADATKFASNGQTFSCDTATTTSCELVSNFGNGKEQVGIKKPNNATCYGDSSVVPIPNSTDSACLVSMNKPYQTVVLAFNKTSDPVPLNVTAGDTTLSAAGTTVTATTLLNATNTTTLCSLATNSVSYSLFVDGKCDSTATTTTVTNKDNKTISVVVPAPAVAATNSVTSSSLMVGTSATVLKDQSTSTLSLENTSTSIFVKADLSCSTGNCNLSNTNTVSFVATQLVGSTLTSLTPATADCKDSICATNLVATNSSSTVIVSATFNGQSVGRQQFISIK